jgi:hypothetical protein
MRGIIAESEFTADSIADYMNTVLLEATAICPGFDIKARCDYSEEVFGAGSDRGGNQIGGPFWTGNYYMGCNCLRTYSMKCNISLFIYLFV